MRHLTSLFFLASFCSLSLAQSDCTNPYDGNGDGAVTINDLLDLLGLFGDVDTDLDGIWDSVDDCVDITACNYAADPTEACAFIDVLGDCGGGCEGDGDSDGICDNEDDCVGVLDECGVCNGPGPTEVVIEDIVITYDSVFLPLDNDWYVFPISADTTFGYTCAPFFGGCGNPVSYQGYDYATVLIGDQCWFAENLRSENYENGDAIPTGLSSQPWGQTSIGAVSVYGEPGSCFDFSPDIDACDPSQSLDEYGRLYNWYAVDDARGLCPSGWHVPTDGEWTVMTDYLGGVAIAGGQMKTDYGWNDGGNGTNSSGFSGLPGGYRSASNGDYRNAGSFGYWWSSSPSGLAAMNRYLIHFASAIYSNDYYLNSGYSVRCIQNSE